MKPRQQRPSQRGLMRLQAFLSDAGVASRRHAEEWILDGRVLVNDRVIEQLPAFVDPENDEVIVDGNRVRPQPHQYWIVHKPRGVVCKNRDPSGRRRAVDFLPPMRTRLFVVGQLDAESSGLILMTNDGELAQRITHPRYGVEKVYRVEVAGQVVGDLPATLRRGVYLAEGKASATQVEVLHRSRDVSALEITLHESLNRQVRRMLAKVGHKVKSLRRIRIGPIRLRDLPLGAARPLDAAEVGALKKAVQRSAAQADANAHAPSRPRGPRKPRDADPARGPARGRPGGSPPRRGAAAPAAAETPGPRRRIVR